MTLPTLQNTLSGSALKVIAVISMTIDHHTRCLWKYMLSLFITACISEIPWQLLIDDGSHNVVLTLLIGLVAVYLMDQSRHCLPLMLLMAASPMVLATALHFDYEWRGVGLTAVFFLFRDRRILTLPFGFPLIMEYGTVGPALGLLVPQMYSGRRGFIKGRWMKYLFYIYYPLHLMVIRCILEDSTF